MSRNQEQKWQQLASVVAGRGPALPDGDPHRLLSTIGKHGVGPLIMERVREGTLTDLMPLVEDVLRRVMRESYRAEGDGGYRRTASEARPVVLVGGTGGSALPVSSAIARRPASRPIAALST